ncbi:MAG TPA: aminodeoxychorismate synthase component I [Pyrinomonadaceae bacterium]
MNYPTLIFDFADERGQPRRLCFSRPVEVVEARTPREVRPALRRVEEAVGAGYYVGGFIAYEAAPAFDSSLVVRDSAASASALPLLWFALFNAPDAHGPVEDEQARFSVSNWSPSIDRHAYERSVAAVREAVARGDTYQTNYTFRLRAHFAGDALAFYRYLCARQRADFCAFLDTGRHKILSASPELFFRQRGRRILTRPMKGTARRGRNAEEDAAQSRWLEGSEKNRAENVMIVDLMRNDLGRVAETGSVRASELCRVETYPTVFQMTSAVEATLRDGATLEDVLAALFPSGSVTGAPKVSTMRLVAALEDSPRGVYCGSVGLIEPGGAAVFNVAIRTVVIDSETGAAEYGTGGGITWDSAAAEEYDEALAKAALLSDK